MKALLGLDKDKDMLASVPGDKSDHSQAIRLGKGLAANRNRRFGKLQIRTSGSWHNQNRSSATSGTWTCCGS